MTIGEQSYFNLETFKHEVLSKGLARNNRFEIIINVPPILEEGLLGISVPGSSDQMKVIVSPNNTKRVSLFCETAAFPNHNIQTKPYRIYGVPYQRPVTSEYGGDGIAFTFYVDRSMVVKNFFDAWTQSIVQKNTFLVSYQKDYAVDMTIKQLDEQNNVTYENILEEAFPRSLNLMELNNSTQGQTHRVIVLFAYRKWNNPNIPKLSDIEL